MDDLPPHPEVGVEPLRVETPQPLVGGADVDDPAVGGVDQPEDGVQRGGQLAEALLALLEGGERPLAVADVDRQGHPRRGGRPR
jgi:hypothetical protein